MKIWQHERDFNARKVNMRDFPRLTSLTCLSGEPSEAAEACYSSLLGLAKKLKAKKPFVAGNPVWVNSNDDD